MRGRAGRSWAVIAGCAAVAGWGVVTGCGASALPAPEPLEAQLDASPSPPRASAPRCALEGSRGEDLRVEVPGHEPFRVSVVEGELSLEPGGDPTRARARVRAPLRFEAVADPADQRLELAGAAPLGAGGVVAAEGARVLSIETSRRGLRAVLVLGRADPAAARGLELAIGPVALDCEQLRIASSAEPPRASAPPRRAPAAAMSIVAAPPLLVRPVRIAPRTLRARPLDAASPFPVWVVDRRDGEARVVVAFADGSQLGGWTAADALRAPTSAESIAVARLTEAAPRDGDPAFDVLGLGVEGERRADGARYDGPARLRARSEIFASRGEGAWARTSEPLEVRARYESDDEHAQLVAVPGMVIDPERAWVRRTALADP